MTHFLHYTLVALAILGMLYVYGSYTESFVNMGEYPSSQTNPILIDDYPVKKSPQLSHVGSEQLYQEQPKSIMSSYAQVTNNKRYWSNPNDGTCSPADFCDSIYNNTSNFWTYCGYLRIPNFSSNTCKRSHRQRK